MQDTAPLSTFLPTEDTASAKATVDLSIFSEYGRTYGERSPYNQRDHYNKGGHFKKAMSSMWPVNTFRS